MKYYLFEASKGDSKIAGKAINVYDTLNLATANWHSKLGVAMKSDLYDSDLAMVFNDEGGCYRSEKYTKEGVEESTEYYLIEISEGDTSIAGYGCYNYATYEEAYNAFYNKMNIAIKSDLFTSELLVIVDSNGGIRKSDKDIKGQLD